MSIDGSIKFINIFQIFAIILIFYSFEAMAQEDLRPAPEIAGEIVQKSAVTARSYMAVSANPEATKVASQMLAAGGSAADAAIAAQLILGLTEPQSSGLGGGAFVLYYDAEKQTLSSWDGRETASELTWPGMFLKPDGSKMDFFEAVIGGRSVRKVVQTNPFDSST